MSLDHDYTPVYHVDVGMTKSRLAISSGHSTLVESSRRRTKHRGRKDRDESTWKGIFGREDLAHADPTPLLLDDV